VKLDGQSAWTVTGDSYITSLELAEGAKLQAPAGKAVVLTVNGVDTPVAPGTYKGQIKVSIR
jgi:hypothetical protein